MTSLWFHCGVSVRRCLLSANMFLSVVLIRINKSFLLSAVSQSLFSVTCQELRALRNLGFQERLHKTCVGMLMTTFWHIVQRAHYFVESFSQLRVTKNSHFWKDSLHRQTLTLALVLIRHTSDKQRIQLHYSVFYINNRRKHCGDGKSCETWEVCFVMFPQNWLFLIISGFMEHLRCLQKHLSSPTSSAPVCRLELL